MNNKVSPTNSTNSRMRAPLFTSETSETSETSFSAFSIRFAGCFLSLSLCLMGGFFCKQVQQATPLASLDFQMAGQAIDSNGNVLFEGNPLAIENMDFEMAWVYKGFLSCPDMCPNALNRLSKAQHLLGRKKKLIATIFVTIDPQKDTLSLLRTRLQSYALSGAVMRDDVSKTERIFMPLTGVPGVPGVASSASSASKASSVGSPHREMSPHSHSHTSRIFLMDSKGLVWETFSAHANESEIAQTTAKYLGWW